MKLILFQKNKKEENHRTPQEKRYPGVQIMSRCRKIPPCQAKCPVSKTNKTSKTPRC